MRKLCVLCFLLVSCKEIDEKAIKPKESVNVSVNTAVREDTTLDEGQVLIIEIEDEAQFIASEDMVKITYNSTSFADSIFQVHEKRRLQEVLIANKDSI